MADEIVRNEASRFPTRAGAVSQVVKRISWPAIWGGLMVAIGVGLLFALFGLFIGFGIYNPKSANPWSGVFAWSTVWYLITAGVSFFFGGWAAAHLSGNPRMGMMHGFVTWGFTALATTAIAVVILWSVLGEGINVLRTAALASAQIAPTAAATAPAQAANATQQAANVAGQVQANSTYLAGTVAAWSEGLSVRLWGGTLLGLITALIGGVIGGPKLAAPEVQPAPQDRLAA